MWTLTVDTEFYPPYMWPEQSLYCCYLLLKDEEGNIIQASKTTVDAWTWDDTAGEMRKRTVDEAANAALAMAGFAAQLVKVAETYAYVTPGSPDIPNNESNS